MKILLVGDSCYDIYHYGNVNRLSAEAPIPIFDKISTYIKNGMASNVYENLVNLGVNVTIFTKFLETKTRYFDIRSGHQLFRVDEKTNDQDCFREINQLFEQDFDSYDCIVISDYNKGFISEVEMCDIINLTKKPVFIDTKKTNLEKFNGAFVKINNEEYQKAKSYCQNLIVTNGDKPVRYKDNYYPINKVEIHDVCGAGDTFLASLAYKYCLTMDINQAIKFAIQASSVTIQHNGVYAPTLKEINYEK